MSVAEDIPREQHAWGRFAPGSWTRIRVTVESIGENGPVISGSRRTIAHTTFQLTWGRDYRERADGSCVIARNVP